MAQRSKTKPILAIRVKFFAAMALLAVSVALAPTVARADLQSGIAAFQSGDHARALAELEPLALHGDPNAQFYVGRIRAEAPGLQDYVQAYKWLSCSIDKGGAVAGVGARLLREQVSMSLDSANLRLAQSLARSECGVVVGADGSDPVERDIYFAKRDGVVESIALFAGDLTIWGALTVAKAFGIEWLRKLIVSLYESYQVWLVALISLVWWGLFIRVTAIIISAIGSGPPVEIREPVFSDKKHDPSDPRATKQLARRLFTDDDIPPEPR